MELEHKNFKTWINFKWHFRTAYAEPQATIDLAGQDTGVYDANMVRYAITRLQEALVGHVLDDTPAENLTTA